MGARGDPERLLAGRDRVAALADVYGALLTARQRELLAWYYEDDLSLAEAGLRTGVSRQAVHDLLRRAVAALQDYEARLGVLRQAAERRRVAAELVRLLEAASTASTGPGGGALGQALALAKALADG